MITMKQTRVYNNSDKLIVDVAMLWKEKFIGVSITIVRSNPSSYFVFASKQNETYFYNGVDFVKESDE